MESKKVICPACGSENVSVTTQKKELKVPFAPVQYYEVHVDQCHDCELEGDFFNANTEVVANALVAARKESAISMMNYLIEKNGFGMAHMERVLELPQRTMMRWKTGDCSAGALALLRIISTYPWTLDVADAQFDSAYATKRLAKEGVKAMCRIADENHYIPKIEVCDFDQNGIQGKFSLKSTKGWASRLAVSTGSQSSANVCLAR